MITSDRASAYALWYRRSVTMTPDPLRVIMFNLCAIMCDAAFDAATKGKEKALVMAEKRWMR